MEEILQAYDLIWFQLNFIWVYFELREGNSYTHMVYLCRNEFGELYLFAHFHTYKIEL